MTRPAAWKRSPLDAVHRRLGARMTTFGGWEMPLYYSSIVEEHHAVRRSVGLFDVSHMGEIEIRGPEALALVSFVTTNAPERLSDGQAQYSALLYPHGGFVDDILVHRVKRDHFFLCVNAANQEKDYEHIRAANRWNASVEFASERYAQLALQGPNAPAVLQKLTATDLSTVRYYRFVDGEVCGIAARIARTGYTGEDGFELYLAPDHATTVWDRLMDAGQAFQIRPCGLGARNTLRLEAKMALYGHEIDASTTPWEADLAWIVKMEKPEFLGRQALERQQRQGLRRKLAGFEMRGRGIGRDGYLVRAGGRPCGWVTSGGPSPTLGKNIGLCYLPPDLASPGRDIEVMIRGEPVPAITVPTPFYKRIQ
ncbi:MAG: glycine cleavage system aminomethyltransferase GcvT [Bryobacterales bacterium]|nr:glycine cleavage system aminomethyltransferase GcvT [Bryobacteraceae bacterium]MDW8353350.1 glycine cleavage system aminomethyltransferase GcvT [Bryobacterales bacterium]